MNMIDIQSMFMKYSSQYITLNGETIIHTIYFAFMFSHMIYLHIIYIHVQGFVMFEDVLNV